MAKLVALASAMPGDQPTPEQRKFIERALQSHALLVAGPGTGKTRTLAYAAQALVEERHVPRERVAALTLTRALASSLATRIPHGRAGTLHSFALWHLNRLGEAWGRRVADPWEVENLVRQDLQLGVEDAFGARPTLPEVNGFLTALGAAFREGQDEPTDLDRVEQRLLQVFKQHRELFRYRLMDELVTDLVDLLEQGTKVGTPPTHVLVDEYQDLTPGELRLLQLLMQGGATIIAAGDDRQSIFGFREADERALHRFPAVYDVGFNFLSESWRCPQRHCQFAEAVAQSLPPLPGLARPPLVPLDGRTDEGVVRVLAAPSPIGEVRWAVAECRRLVLQGDLKPPEIMIVVAGFFDPVFDNLNRAVEEIDDLPFGFYDPRGFDPVAKTVAVRLLGAGARLLVDGQDQMAWRTLVWATPRLGETKIARILTANQGSYVRNLEATAARDRTCARAFTAGQSLREKFQGHENVVAREIVEHLAQELGGASPDLEPLSAVSLEWETAAPPGDWVAGVIELSQKTLVAPEERPEGIPVRTIYGAKGLEAPVVLVVNCLEQCFTSRGSVADGVRLLYVAVTRAKQRLYVSAPRYLRGSRVGHMAGSASGGLASLIKYSAARAGLQIEAL